MTFERQGSGATLALWIICAVACAFFVFAALQFVFGPGFDVSQNSDAVVAGLLADEILQRHSLLPDTWYFGNDEIWTISTQIFALPFVAALGLAPFALKLANLLVLAVVLGLFTLLIRRVTHSLPFSITVALCVFSCFSAMQAQLVYVQPPYAWFCAQFAAMTYLALRMQEDRSEQPLRPWQSTPFAAMLYALVLFNLATESPLRAAVYWVVPIVGVCVAFPVSRRRAIGVIAVSVVAALAGAAAHFVLAKHLLVIPGAPGSLVQPVDHWIPSLSALLSGLRAEAGSIPSASLIAAVFEPGTLRIVFLAVAAIAVWFVAPRGPASIECRFFARVAGAMLLTVLVVLIVGRLAYNSGAIRYLTPPAFLCLAAFMASLWQRFAATRGKWVAAIAAVFVLAFCGGGVAYAWSTVSLPHECESQPSFCKLQSALRRNGLHMGYASYWNANVTTLASSNEVRVCGVVLRPRLAPFRWLVSKDCFDPPRDERYFIVLARGERQEVERAALRADAGTPDSVVNDGDYELWIYKTAGANLAWLTH